MDISEVPGCHLLWQMCVQSGSQKLLQSLVSHELTAYLSGVILFILNEWWPYYQKDIGQIVLNLNSQQRSFINIWGLCLNFVDCESFLESNSPDIPALCETNLDDSIDLGNFSVRVILLQSKKILLLICMAHSLCEGRTSLWTGLSADSYLCFLLALLHSVFYFIYLNWPPSLCLCTVFDFISSKIVEVLLIHPSANVFVFGDFNAHHKDWLTYSGGTVQTCKTQTTLLRWLTFVLGFQTVTVTMLLFWIYFFCC